MRDITKLATPIPEKYLQTVKKGGQELTYAPHGYITQALIATLGGYDLQVRQIIRGNIEPIMDRKTGEVRHPGRTDAVVGVIIRLIVQVDGEDRVIEEAGSCEHPQMKHDGDTLKDAMSDALKRAAMRLGLGLHLWCPEGYVLDRALKAQDEADLRIKP